MKIVIADDSAIARGILEKAFREDGFEIAALLSNGRKAVDFCRENLVDAVVSDCDMPEMDGIAAAKILSKEIGVPVALYSENAGQKMAALEAGACCFVQRASLSSYNRQTLQAFVQKIKDALSKTTLGSKRAFVPERPSVRDESCGNGLAGARKFGVLCVGASTGGPTAMQEVLLGLGGDFPLPILYAQHIDIGADEKMAKWFNQVCPNIPMELAKDGQIARPGRVYMAAADTHLMIDYVKGGLPVLKVSNEPPERFLRPAVNKLFRSAAKHFKNECLAVLLTGMGQDGAEGCKEIVAAGGWTICEDKSTCAVFGMPAAAIEMNAATKILPRGEIAKAILRLVG